MIKKPKKSLGQNFLVDKNILNKITNFAKLNDNDEVLEIGAGTGALTDFINKKKPKKIHVIEKDENLALILKNRFEKDVNIINDDILNFNDNSIGSENLIIMGNLPYNISSQILVKFIVNKNNFKFKKLIFMFQKEMADRVVAKVNSTNYGRFSILANWKFNIKKVLDINPNSFSPKPKVMSSLLVFTPKENFTKFEDIKNLEHVTNVFFNQRRKKIKKPINLLFKNKLSILKKYKLDLNLRPQNLTKYTYYKICSFYEKFKLQK